MTPPTTPPHAKLLRPPSSCGPAAGLEIHGATDRPVTLIQLAEVGAVTQPTARHHARAFILEEELVIPPS